MQQAFKNGVLALLLSGVAGAAWSEQTLVFVRHGEKPDNNSGQLTCQGFNRALALPDVLIGRYGKPEAIFAAGPKKNKLGSSLRALTTITPTAIRLSMPINIQYHADEIAGLQTALLDERLRNAVVYVSWEHHNLEQVVKNIVTAEGGDPKIIGKWAGQDFDSIYVLTIDHEASANKIRFEHQTEGLNDVAETCSTKLK